MAPTVMPVLPRAVFCFGLLTRQEGSVLVKAALLLLFGLGLWLVNRVITSRVETLKAEELA